MVHMYHNVLLVCLAAAASFYALVVDIVIM